MANWTELSYMKDNHTKQLETVNQKTLVFSITVWIIPLWRKLCWSYPGCMQDPLGVVDTVQAASLDTEVAYQDTGEPLDNRHEDTQTVPVVFHMHHTWAPLGSWPLGSAGLWVKNKQSAVKGKLLAYYYLSAKACTQEESISYHRKVSCPSVASSGKDSSRSTWSSTPWWQWWPQTGGWRRQCQLKWWDWEDRKEEDFHWLQSIDFVILIIQLHAVSPSLSHYD